MVRFYFTRRVAEMKVLYTRCSRFKCVLNDTDHIIAGKPKAINVAEFNIIFSNVDYNAFIIELEIVSIIENFGQNSNLEIVITSIILLNMIWFIIKMLKWIYCEEYVEMKVL
ncbi:MAG: hypothetical protein Ta2E_00910 [Mycoplasmoidaceae bacterium]|nr:MAG: hypothetical protein Ta2E_00910 [Mycoplasmoidaceae bacterium]